MQCLKNIKLKRFADGVKKKEWAQDMTFRTVFTFLITKLD